MKYSLIVDTEEEFLAAKDGFSKQKEMEGLITENKSLRNDCHQHGLERIEHRKKIKEIESEKEKIKKELSFRVHYIESRKNDNRTLWADNDEKSKTISRLCEELAVFKRENKKLWRAVIIESFLIIAYLLSAPWR